MSEKLCSKSEREINITKWNILFGDKTNCWMAVAPEEGMQTYVCYACRDIFSSKNSFLDHVNRVTMTLKYKCPYKCEDTLFYNSCALLLHARGHFRHFVETINLNYINIGPVPDGCFGFPPFDNIPMIYNCKEDLIDDRYVKINTKFYSPSSNNKGSNIVELTSIALIFYQTKMNSSISMILKQISSNVPKCVFVVDNTSLNAINVVNECPVIENNTLGCTECKSFIPKGCVKRHFEEQNSLIDDKLKCDTCKLILPSKCSKKAHMRIHRAIPPYVCPDCGDKFDKFKNLLEHIESICFHASKTVRIKCPKKNCNNTYSQKILGFHEHMFDHMININKCSVCEQYFNDADWEFHTANVHPNADKTTFLRCPDCSNINFTEQSIKEHIITHFNDKELRTYAYICKYCRKSFKSIATIRAHRCLKIVPYFISKLKSLKNDWYCADCRYFIRMNMDLCSCPMCGKSYSMNLHEKNENLNCLLCSKKIVKGEEHTCVYSNPVVPVERNVELNKLNESVKRPSAANPIKKKRKPTSPVLPKKQIVKEPIQLDSPKPFEGVYVCKICNFESSLRGEFHDHVKNHRDISTEFQCMECGQCFVVRPSFEKHLAYYHEITDSEKYVKENNCVDEAAVKKLKHLMKCQAVSDEPVGENQCEICRKQFNDELELKKHFRVHGMAFLLNNSKN